MRSVCPECYNSTILSLFLQALQPIARHSASSLKGAPFFLFKKATYYGHQFFLEPSLRQNSSVNTLCASLYKSCSTCNKLLFKVRVQRETSQLLQPLCDVSECHCKSLHSRERVLKVQYIGVPVDPSKLHNLYRETKVD